jgi:hypothetical protein
MKRYASSVATVVALLTVLVVSPDAARDAAAQIVPAVAIVVAGNGEGPSGQDSNEGHFGAVASASGDEPEFGTANARALVAGPDIAVKGSATSAHEPAFVAGGSGFWYDTPKIRILASLVGPTDVLAVQFDLAVGWKISSNGGYGFQVNGRSTDWSTAQGGGENTLGVGFGSGGQQTLPIVVPLENVHTVVLGGQSYREGQYTLDMSISASASSGSHTHGSFGSASMSASMKASGFHIVKQPAGGQAYETVEGEIISETGVVYASLPSANADFDLDGDVDGSDFLVWQANYPTASGAMRSEGNANVGADGATDALDLEAWKSQFGTAVTFDPDPVTAVPEPSALPLLLLASLFPRRQAQRRRAL